MFPEITRDDVFRLETERLWLRWPRAADAEEIRQHVGDPDVALMTASIPHPYAPHDADAFIASAREENGAGGGLHLVITPKNRPNEPIGLVSLHGADRRGSATFGFWLGKPYWGQGYTTEAARALIDLAFGITSLDRIVSAARPDNRSSLHVHEKLGFHRTGSGMRPAPARGGDMEVELFELKRGEAHTLFGARRPRFFSP
ncbi:GNAT family N-acetyltransferase [Methylocystis sp. H62]|uniref:GNAT family N-acetyltransferase n=1 Tax=Methylocystis sp. H62 TaxID=2785789 RepID=UPI0018C1F51C|nr:GNAT family N-acetyltransferase [Methylocystis sp. H62]MBG0795089.1 GNAT family N-acetyltransferase [Methylocystis sp. H62]